MGWKVLTWSASPREWKHLGSNWAWGREEESCPVHRLSSEYLVGAWMCMCWLQSQGNREGRARPGRVGSVRVIWALHRCCCTGLAHIAWLSTQVVLKESSTHLPKCRGESRAWHREHEHSPTLPLPCSPLCWGSVLAFCSLVFLCLRMYRLNHPS